MHIGALSAETRARNVALGGLLLQIVLAVCLLLVYLLTRSLATFAASRYMFGGGFIWLALLMLYQQRRQVAREALETEHLQRERREAGADSIFELGQEEFLVAQRRLKWMQRWLLPAFVLGAVVYLLGGHFFLWPGYITLKISDDVAWKPVQHSSLSMLIIAGIAFLAFLFSRYVSGMSRQPEYRLLRAGSIYLFGGALIGLLLTVCLGLVSTNMVLPERILGMGLRYLLVLIGLEFLVSYVLDFYRPRGVDEIIRPAFESRIIGLISEPEGIAKSIADAVNYQFGFEVSTTWFYKLLERAVVPLAALALLVLLSMTSVVVVDADELAVVERFGRPLSDEPVKPGLHFKMPWPVDRARKAKTGLIQEVVIGEATEEKKEREAGVEEVITWTEEHKFVPSIDVVVATPESAGLSDPASGEEARSGRSVTVSILRMSMPVQYRVRSDPDGFFDYMYNYARPQDMLRDIAYRELVKQAVHFDYQKIMAEQRREVTDRLQSLIQQRCDEMKLGLEVVFVALQDVHPPTESDVAATFQQVATAEQHKDTLIQSAEVEYTKQLISAAGDVDRAHKIHELIRQKGALTSDDPQHRDPLNRELSRYMLGDPSVGLLPVQGDAGQKLQEARADAQDRISRAAAKASTFASERIAYQASPRLYRTRAALAALSQELDKARKYVVIVDPAKTKFICQLNEEDQTGLQIPEPPPGQ